LRHAIREASQFSALVFDGGSIHLSEALGIARLTFELPTADALMDRFTEELVAAGVVRMLRSFGAGRGDLRAVCFRHKRPAQDRSYAEVFQGTERFAAQQPCIEFAAQLLDRPHLHCNPSLQKLVHAQAEERLAQLARPASVVDRLRALLLQRPSASVPDMEVAARRLGVSVRSLRRHLAEDGVSYRALTQALQCERACAMLRNPELSLQVIADALGFADLVAFHRAFKRWTGMTACEYRESQRSSCAG
jgi:AraC-like DNA-binding protein